MELLKKPGNAPRGPPEVVLPVAQRLETVHHGAIEPVGSARQDENDSVAVYFTQVGFLPPCYARECSAGEEEMAFGGFDGEDFLPALEGS
jgi:hypothetical protein